jgi:hypothetical protein
MVNDEAVDAAEGSYGGGDEGLAVFGGVEVVLDGDGLGWASAGFGEFVGEGGGGLVAEGYFGSGLMEEADGGGSDASGASGDEGYFVVEGERDAWVELRSVLRHILDAIESFFRTQASPVSNFFLRS